MAAVRTTFSGLVGAKASKDELLACVQPLQAKDRAIHEGCVKLIRAGNPHRAIQLLDMHGGGAPSPPSTEIQQLDGVGRAEALSWATWASWLGVAALSWIQFPGVGVSIGLIVGCWILTIVALVAGGSVASRIYEHYSGLGDLGALVFLAVPLTLPIGFIWTVVRALRIHKGLVDGPGHDAQPGGGYARFDTGRIGAAGRPIGRTLLAVAVGHASCVAALVAQSGIVDHMEIVPS